MREIKFRAYKSRNGKMYEVKNMTFKDTWLGVNGIDSIGINYLDSPIDNEFELMQYTGQIDMDGTEIYEGDILQIYNAQTSRPMVKREVWYNGQSCRFNGLALSNSRLMKVVGNIYGTEDLIK